MSEMNKSPKEMTRSQIREEIERLKKGLKIRKDYEPDNSVIQMIKERLKILEKEV